MPNELEQNHELPVKHLIVSSNKIPSHMQVSIVADLFRASTDCDALAVVEGRKPVALITRSKLLTTLSRRFGYELYAKDPISVIADHSPLMVDGDDWLDSVVDRAFARDPQNIYDEIIVTDPDGSYFGLLSVKQLVIQQSEALSRSIVQREMAAARSRELEQINHLKTQFIANVTHELRSPVNAIIGLSELLRMAAEAGSIDKIRERLTLLMASATNLRGIIANILDMSKMEAGKMDVASQAVDVGSLMNDVAEMTRILLKGKPVDVRVMTPPESAMIMTDQIKLRQILTNLTSNAAKFTDHGTIDICLTNIAGSMVIEVRDTGVGIRKEDLDLIFTAFSQVEDAATKAHEGTGLGLTISRNLAKLIGGTISVASTYGKGSTFSLSLPITQTTTEGVHDYAA